METSSQARYRKRQVALNLLNQETLDLLSSAVVFKANYSVIQLIMENYKRARSELLDGVRSYKKSRV